MVYEIIAGIATLLLAVLVFYIVKVLKELQVFLRTTRVTLERVEAEAIPLVKNSSELINKVHKELNALDPIFNSVSNVGSFIDEATTSLSSHKLASFQKKKTSWQDTMSDILELTSVGLKVFNNFKREENYEKKHKHHN